MRRLLMLSWAPADQLRAQLEFGHNADRSHQTRQRIADKDEQEMTTEQSACNRGSRKPGVLRGSDKGGRPIPYGWAADTHIDTTSWLLADADAQFAVPLAKPGTKVNGKQSSVRR